MRYLSNDGGFTFVELLAVVLLMGVLVLIALPNYFGAEGEAKKAVDQANVRSINAALICIRQIAALYVVAYGVDASVQGSVGAPSGKEVVVPKKVDPVRAALSAGQEPAFLNL